MNTIKELKSKSLFRDKNGSIVLWQWPNVTLYGWLLFKGISLLINPGHIKTGLTSLSMAFLFVWAYLEITKGVDYFRRALGFIVIISIILSYFK